MTSDGVGSYHRFLKGDQQALEDLMRIYGDALIRFAYSFLHDLDAAGDIMDETFAVLLVRRRYFPEERSLKAFLFKVARNKCLDFLRRRKKILSLNEEISETISINAEEEILLSERDKTLYSAMQTLAAQYRMILELIYLEGFSVGETAKILKKSRKQIYNLLERAKRALRKILEKEGFQDESVFGT